MLVSYTTNYAIMPPEPIYVKAHPSIEAAIRKILYERKKK